MDAANERTASNNAATCSHCPQSFPARHPSDRCGQHADASQPFTTEHRKRKRTRGHRRTPSLTTTASSNGKGQLSRPENICRVLRVCSFSSSPPSDRSSSSFTRRWKCRSWRSSSLSSTTSFTFCHRSPSSRSFPPFHAIPLQNCAALFVDSAAKLLRGRPLSSSSPSLSASSFPSAYSFSPSSSTFSPSSSTSSSPSSSASSSPSSSTSSSPSSSTSSSPSSSTCSSSFSPSSSTFSPSSSTSSSSSASSSPSSSASSSPSSSASSSPSSSASSSPSSSTSSSPSSSTSSSPSSSTSSSPSSSTSSSPSSSTSSSPSSSTCSSSSSPSSSTCSSSSSPSSSPSSSTCSSSSSPSSSTCSSSSSPSSSPSSSTSSSPPSSASSSSSLPSSSTSSSSSVPALLCLRPFVLLLFISSLFMSSAVAQHVPVASVPLSPNLTIGDDFSFMDTIWQIPPILPHNLAEADVFHKHSRSFRNIVTASWKPANDKMCHIWTSLSPGDLCVRNSWARVQMMREMSLFTKCPEGFANLQLIELFRLDWRSISSEEDLLAHSEHLREGPMGRGCLIGSANSAGCLKCFERLRRALEQVESVHWAFANLLHRFDCRLANFGLASATQPFSPNTTCHNCAEWYRKWLLVNLVDLWKQPPCINWCYYTQLACPHLATNKVVEFAGHPVFLCKDQRLSAVEQRPLNCSCFHPCDMVHGRLSNASPLPAEGTNGRNDNNDRQSQRRQWDNAKGQKMDKKTPPRKRPPPFSEEAPPFDFFPASTYCERRNELCKRQGNGRR